MLRRVCVLTLYDAFSSWFAAGALAHVDVEKARAMHKAVIKKDWQNARELLRAVSQGKLSGSADPLLYRANFSRSTI